MTPVAYSLDKLQGESTFYFGYMVPVIHQAIKKLDAISNENRLFASPISNTLSAGIRTRFRSICELNLAEVRDAVLATISLPFFKLRWI